MRRYRKRIKIRVLLLCCILSLFFLFLIGNLVKLQAYERDKYIKLADSQHTGMIEISALRGSIYDRHGSVMAFSVARPSVAVNPRMLKNPDRTAFLLSLALGTKKNDIIKGLKASSTFVWVARKIDEKTAMQIESLELPGVFILNETSGKRFHPKRREASHILGYTGIDDQGLEGVEASYDDLLKGRPGLLTARMDQRGRILPGEDFLVLPNTKKNMEDLRNGKIDSNGKTIFIPPVPGKDIYLTIDETVQYIVEKELENTVKEFNAAGGTIIVYDPRTGDIISLASYPDYLPSQGTRTHKKLIRNRAVVDAYEPGSTFKVILAAAALDSGVVTTKDLFYCGQSIEVGGYSLRNADDGIISPAGRETVEGVITYSFNVGAADMGLRIGNKVLHKYVDTLGFGKLSGIDIPGEAEGILIPLKYWKPINLATISYGQGIAVTPIQMVQAYGAIANDGVLMKPRLVRKIVDRKGNLVEVKKPKVIGKPLRAKTTHELLKILHNVCENGTGKAAKIEGYKVGGKTGTANVVENGVYSSNKFIASFVGVAPIDDPKIVMIIKIDEPKGVIWGGCVAAPAFKDIGSQILWRLGAQPKKSEKVADLTPPEAVKTEKEKQEEADKAE
ncbi:MAG: stage V sporulation protein D [Candidatus Eremiobacteraeota bacterium]|nr:stage V sporulation protein D [Candidatus Eremiobacteraeota bacterium]